MACRGEAGERIVTGFADILMTDHPCPFGVGELMALHAIVKVAGFELHAARLLAHAEQHDTPPAHQAPVES